MKIKRYLDKDMRHVLRRVREDQGPDAVILSNRRVEGGIEVIAALDYDEALVRHALGRDLHDAARINSDALAGIAEDDVVLPPVAASVPASDSASDSVSDSASDSASDSVSDSASHSEIEILTADLAPVAVPRLDEASNDLAIKDMQSDLSTMRDLLESQLSDLVWKDGSRRFPLRAQVLRNLSRLGIAPDIANIVIDRLEPMTDVKSIWHAPLTTLAQTLPVVDDTLLQNGGTIALIGPTGVGKTTTIAKIAARFATNSWSDDIALVSADSYKIGAKEHLMAFANIIGAKVYSVSNFDEMSETLTGLRDKKLVLIDTEGRSQRDRDLASQLAAYGRNADRVRFYLTLSAATQEAALDETIRAFSKVPLEGAIVTKIDEAAQLGCIISALIRNDLPAAWLADGQRIPDDLHSASRKKLWLVNQAIDCMEASQPRIDERTMAEQFSHMSTANA